jgi:hypothetical protein
MYINLSYSDAEPILKEADILLVRGTGFIAWCIKLITGSCYSHVGLLSKSEDMWEIIEFHANSGGVSRSLINVVKKYSGRIDVFRPSSLDEKLYYCPHSKKILSKTTKLDQFAVTKKMRSLTGLQYGLLTIILLFLQKLWVYRLFTKYDEVNAEHKLNKRFYPICSNSIAFAFAKNGFYILKNKPFEFLTPGDLALSSNLDYLFTLVFDEKVDEKFLPS